MKDSSKGGFNFVKSFSIDFVITIFVIVCCLLYVNWVDLYYQDNNFVESVKDSYKDLNSLLLLTFKGRFKGNWIRFYYRVVSTLVSDNINLNVKDIMKIHGSYDNYLKSINKGVSDDFMKEFYPEYFNNYKFRTLLNILDPIIITNKELVIKCFKLITKYNDLCSKLLLYSDLLNKDLIKTLISDIYAVRKDLIVVIKDLGANTLDVNELLSNINKKVKNKILVDSTVNFKENIKVLEQDSKFIELWGRIKNIIIKDANIKAESEEFDINKAELHCDINILKNFVLELYALIVFIRDNNISTAHLDRLLLNLINDMVALSSNLKIETYKMKKGNRQKRISRGNVIGMYKNIINKYGMMMENIIVEFIIDDLKNNVQNDLTDIKDVGVELINQFNNKVYKDHKLLLNSLNSVFDRFSLITDLSKSFSSDHLSDKTDRFNDTIVNKLANFDMSHDDLFKINKLISGYSNEDVVLSRKETSLTENSYIYQKARDILLINGISDEQKQILLETFILNYEKEFSLNVIRNMDDNLIDFKLLTRIFKHSTPAFASRVEAFINNNKKRNFEKYFNDKENIGDFGSHVALALFLLIKPEQLMSIIFSKIIRIIGMSGGIKQTDFLTSLIKELISTLSHNYCKDENLAHLSLIELEVVNSICSRLDSITVESRFQFGILIMEFIFSEFDYMFVKHTVTENKENHIYLNVKPEYLAVLQGSIFNPIRLPMVAKPKEWQYKDGGSYQGGYYLDEFNELSSNNKIIRQNTFNKFDSIISVEQVEAINFLNSRAFEINQEVLNLLITEWNNKTDSKLFKNINMLHPKTAMLDKLSTKEKNEVMSHNSKYWNYSNILNIAMLMVGKTVYFPTYLDFRGRIYPTPNYLSYQSNDLARSLLLFRSVDTETSSNPVYKKILKSILTEDIYNSENKAGNKLTQNIDYVKLYLANVYGKSKLSRKGKIKWFNNNIDQMVEAYNESWYSFMEKYVIVSKEPFQFISIFISYYNYIYQGEEIKTPILFDATCSGIQHLSALTKDIKIANLVNLVQKESPSDFYQYCIDKIELVLKDVPDLVLRNKISQLTITRKWIKQSIMTVPYNVTTKGIADKLGEKFDMYYLTNIDLLNLQKGNLTLQEVLRKLENSSNLNNLKETKEISDIKDEAIILKEK